MDTITVKNMKLEGKMKVMMRSLQVDIYGFLSFLSRRSARGDYDLSHHGFTMEESYSMFAYWLHDEKAWELYNSELDKV